MAGFGPQAIPCHPPSLEPCCATGFPVVMEMASICVVRCGSHLFLGLSTEYLEVWLGD